MKECRVIFDPSVNDEDIRTLVEAIKMFRGVYGVDFNAGPPGDQRVQASVVPPPNTRNDYPPPPGASQPQRGDVLQTQRHVIDEAIKWGVHNKKITVEELQNLSAEEIVQYSFKFIDMMPEELRARLGEELSVIYGGDS